MPDRPGGIRDFTVDYRKIASRDAATRLGQCTRVEVPSRGTNGGAPQGQVLTIDF